MLVLLFLSADGVRRSREIMYNIAIAEFTDGNYQDTIDTLDTLNPINEYKDAQKHILYSEAMLLFSNA